SESSFVRDHQVCNLHLRFTFSRDLLAWHILEKLIYFKLFSLFSSVMLVSNLTFLCRKIVICVVFHTLFPKIKSISFFDIGQKVGMAVRKDLISLDLYLCLDF